MATSFQARQTPTFLARLENREYGVGSGASGSGDEINLIQASDIESITYTIYKISKVYGDSSRAVTGHGDNGPVTIDKDLAFQEFLITEDPNWTEDETGYNFKWTPDSTENKAFPTPGTYMVQFEATMVTGNPICWSRKLTFT